MLERESIIQGSGLKDEVITFEDSFPISQLLDNGSEAYSFLNNFCSLVTKIKRKKLAEGWKDRQGGKELTHLLLPALFQALHAMATNPNYPHFINEDTGLPKVKQ